MVLNGFDTSSESGEPLWSCKCTLGYSGTVTIPGLEATVPEGPFHVEGECKAIPGRS